MPRCPVRTREYRGRSLADEGFEPGEIDKRLAAADDAVVWLDLTDPDEDDLQVVVEEFGLHPLAVEDAVAEHQRPKLDQYDTHLFLNAYTSRFDQDRLRVDTCEVSAFILPRALITVRQPGFDVGALVSRWEAGASVLGDEGVGWLVHGLLDLVVDTQYAAAELLDDAVEDLEECLFGEGSDLDVRREGYNLRKAVVQLRRVVVPMREVLRQVLRPEGHLSRPAFVTERLEPYFQDVLDHALSAAEGVDGVRDMVVGILDTSLNEQSYAQNDITKRLASWAAIIAVPTAVTGFYGQNVPYPGFSKWWGFLTSVAVMAVLVIALYVLLRRKRWL